MKKIIIGAFVCAFLGVMGFGADAMASNHRKKVDGGQSQKKHVGHQKKAGAGKHLKAGDADADADAVAVYVSDGTTEDSDGVITHSISFWIGADTALRKAKTIKLTPPKSKKPVEIKNGLGLSAVTLDADGLLEKDFIKTFPAGAYTVALSPGGNITVNVDHDYPATPVVTSPEDGDTEVSLTPTISWESLADEDIDGVYLSIYDSEDEVYYDEVSADTTEYDIPEEVLQPDTDYFIYVGTYRTDDDGHVEVYSESLVEITTAAE